MAIALKYRNAIYVGQTNFDDVCQPVYSKSEYGIDIITRKMRGAASRLLAFVSSLQQGQPMVSIGHIDISTGQNFPGFGNTNGLASFALQTWTTDDDPVYPTVTLNFKGLLSGVLPKPLACNSQTLQTSSLSCNINTSATVIIGGQSFTLSGHATRTIQYYANQTDWKYVTNQRISAGTQTELSGIDPIIRQSSIRDDNLGIVFSQENAPAAYVTALFPAIVIQQMAFNCDPVPGTPYFEISETQARLFASNA